MRLRSKNNSGTGASGGHSPYQPNIGSLGIPRNPVFYPPTPKNDYIDIFNNNTQISLDQSRASRLVSRIKTMFSAKSSPVLYPMHHMLSPHDGQPGDTKPLNSTVPQNISARRSVRRPKLVARSPLREDSILSDLCILAETGHPPHTGQYNDFTAVSGRTFYSPYTTYSRSRSHLPSGRRHFTVSVFSPSFSMSDYSNTAGQSCNLRLGATFLHDNPTTLSDPEEQKHQQQFPSRSRSLMVSRRVSTPGLASMPPLSEAECQQKLSSPKSHPRGSRDSHISESTAVFDMEPASEKHTCEAELTEHGSSKKSSMDSTCSPSQKTINATIYASTAEFISSAFAEYMIDELPLLDTMFNQDMDVFQISRTSRRPYSEGFPEHPQSTGNDQFILCGNNDNPISVGATNSQRVMFIRSSCADVDLVKSTFDLAKLLPNIPQ
ncbi:hypothetical protein GGI25_003705 [Coemansia spiralis]|uniref:Uncharacterized protein n=2 Tax=Coemansia TaxID=4863 RepID=A0A9W8G1N2_9FUNG|nr:hypothetical protein BX070DRAFT_136879 [Coemansia spiralis]KAJ1991961.1 hypothetical protein EDC05_003115 [Coemansia umbellata]KAJ2625332.1 hypothetical protein GGI26_000802 [Coemansia sp. RSA 1358]KAJ2676199.1 hypothetical protein GGI25_003705 [Coemansia spiralis]